MTHEEYLALIERIDLCNKKYYEEDDPIMTDAEYDVLTRSLKDAEREHPEWVTRSSPTQHVAGKATAPFQKTRHRFHLLSLNDLFDLEAVKEWYDGIGAPKVDVEEKIDGLTMALTYVDGVLDIGATRGDGYVGEVVTDQAREVRGVPHRLDLPDGVEARNLLIVRVEVNQPVKDFWRVNDEQEALGQKPFANPRNCAAGGLRAKNPKVTRHRGLQAIAFQIIHAEGWDAVRGENPTQSGDVGLLGRLGFIPVTQYHCEDFEQLLDAIYKIGSDRLTLPYWTDGAVVKTDDLGLQARIGATEKYPLHSVAYKYPAETKTTTVREIRIQTGRTGVLTPVAIFDPIQLSGTTVSRATLHNQKFISDRMINVDAEISVLKSGEIIPKVVGVPRPADEPFRITHCPVCGAAAVLSADENGNSDTEVMVCPNMTGCPAQKLRYFEFFCSRDVMDIRGMGPSVIAALIDAGFLDDVADIYRLRDHQDDMAELDGIGTRKISALVASIERSKENDIDRLIKSLGIPGVGRHIGKAVARKYPDMDGFINATAEELMGIDGIGEVSAIAIRSFWLSDAGRKRYEDLRDAGCNVLSLSFSADDADARFSGMTFVVTGTLPTLSREDAKALIEANGGKVSGSVSKKTTYVLAGEKAGSKLDKANALGIPVISEEDLHGMLS